MAVRRRDWLRYMAGGAAATALPSCAASGLTGKPTMETKEKPGERRTTMEPTIKCGKHLALHAKLTGSRFEDVCLGEAEFENVSLARAKLHDVNMSDMTIECVQIGGTTFRHVGLPPEQRPNKQRPLLFDDCEFTGSTFKECDMSGVSFTDCILDGARVDGVLITDLVENYEKNSQQGRAGNA